LLNVPPGAIGPEFHATPLSVTVWAVESLFVHITEPPTDTVTGFGEYAVVVSVLAPETITAATGEPGDGVGEGVGAVDGEDDPHATQKLNISPTRMNRKLIE
jgi:hypothetical protein